MEQIEYTGGHFKITEEDIRGTQNPDLIRTLLEHYNECEEEHVDWIASTAHQGR